MLNKLSVMAALLLARTAGLVVQVILAATLAPDYFGRITWLFAIFSAILPLLTLSLTDAATYLSMRDGGEGRGYLGIVRSYLSYSFIFFTAASLVLIAAGENSALVFHTAVFLILQFLFYLFAQPLRLTPAGNGYFHVVLLFNAVLLATLPALLAAGIGYASVAWSAVAAFVACVALLPGFRAQVGNLWRAAPVGRSRQCLGQIASFSSTNLISQAGMYIDLVVLGAILGSADLAEYRTASLFLLGVVTLPTVLFAALAPQIAARSGTEEWTPWQGYMNFLRRAFVPALVILAAVGYLADDLYGMLFGAAYPNGPRYVQLMLAMMAIGMLVRIPAGNLLAYSGASRVNAFNGLLGIAVSSFAIFVLGRAMGVPGAIWGATASWAMMGGVSLYFIYRRSQSV